MEKKKQYLTEAQVIAERQNNERLDIEDSEVFIWYGKT